jgi:hypothetical protein
MDAYARFAIIQAGLPHWMRREEAISLLKTSGSQLSRWCKAGVITSRKDLSDFRIVWLKRSDVEQLIVKRENSSAQNCSEIGLLK